MQYLPYYSCTEHASAGSSQGADTYPSDGPLPLYIIRNNQAAEESVDAFLCFSGFWPAVSEYLLRLGIVFLSRIDFAGGSALVLANVGTCITNVIYVLRRAMHTADGEPPGRGE